MIQSVSAVSVSPPASAAPQDAPARGQIEVSAGPLPPSSAAQAAQFGEFLKATKVDEVALRNRFVQGAAKSRLGGAIDGAMKHLSEFEARARVEVLHPAEGSFSAAPSHADVAGGAHLGPAGSAGARAPDVSGLDLDHLSVNDVAAYQERAAQSTLMVMEFEIESTLYSKAVEKGEGSVTQLVQEK